MSLLLAQTLRPIANALLFLSTKVHSTAFPYPWANTLHAARISIVFQANSHRAGTAKTMGWKAWLSGFMVMAWGGMLFSHLLLALPPPVLYAPQPYINYLSVHLLLTALFSFSPDLLSPSVLSTLDLVLFPLDALLRANAVVTTLSHLEKGSPNYALISPQLVSSPLSYFILGCTASGGGGGAAATLGVWNANWSVSTPVFLRKGPPDMLSNVMSTLDVWGGGLVALIYGLSMGHPAFKPLLSALSPYAYAFTNVSVDEMTPLSPLGAKSLGAGVLAIFFGLRVLMARAAARSAKSAKKQ